MHLAPERQESIFISASIPDPTRWVGDFDALEITDAVVALARACLTAGFRLVTAAHPTIAPLLLYVAAEFPPAPHQRILVYQSDLFADVLPTATRRFEAEEVGTLVWTPAAMGDRPEPGRWDASLAMMREQMFRETAPIAACFVGGMSGISVEYELFVRMFPDHPTYAVGRPGGEARSLTRRSPDELAEMLGDGDVYPDVWRRVLSHLTSRR
jgi:hypothetical protein